MMLQARPRLTADPTVSVADLTGPLETFMESERENNVFKVLQPPAMTSWKSGFPVGWLVSLGDLFKSYIMVAPRTILSAKKHRQAMQRLLETKKWGHSKKTNDDAADLMDDWIRMGLAHLRVLKQHPEKKEAAVRKCDKLQREALESILCLINVEVNEVKQVPNQELSICHVPADSQKPAPEANPSPKTP